MRTLKFIAYNHPCEPERVHTYYMHVADGVAEKIEQNQTLREAYAQRAQRAMMESLWSMMMESQLPEVTILDPESCNDESDWRALSAGLEWGCKFD